MAKKDGKVNFRSGDGKLNFELDEQTIGCMKMTDLKKELRKRKLKTTGSKKELAARLEGAVLYKSDDDDYDEIEDDDSKNNSADEVENDDEVPSDEDAVRISDDADFSLKRADRVQFAVSFRDVEDTIRVFDGNTSYPVKQWIRDFDETAVLFGWTEIQKLIFAKRSLSGLAKLFIQSEGVIKSWKQLKNALISEFHSTVNSADLHDLLNSRKMRKDETLQEYFLAMKALASSGEIKNDALITYVINGIVDDERNKFVLYGAKTVQEFKEKLKVYESIRKRSSAVSKNKVIPNKTFVPQSNVNKMQKPKSGPAARCYNCGEVGHKSNDCASKSLGFKCFRCGNFGHKSNECTRNNSESDRSNVSVIRMPPSEKMLKTISVNNVKVKALVDTGSQATLIKLDAFNKLENMDMKRVETSLTGFGGTTVKTLGTVQTTIELDDELTVNANMLVVPNFAMTYDVLIGTDMLSQVEIMINDDGVTFLKKSPSVFLTRIDVPENPQPAFDHIKDEIVRKETETVVTDYTPMKTKDVDVKMSIFVKDESPVFQRPRRLPIKDREIVDNQVKEWLKDGIIEECSSEYASPVVVVRKKDGSPRICIDYRKINRLIVKDRYPLPLIEDLIDRLCEAKVFSTIDLKNGFFHVAVDERSRKYTSFITHSGQYQFKKVPFGLCNSPSVFQRFINHVFVKHSNDGRALIYMDDVIIPAPNSEEALVRLKSVLNTASEHGLEINLKKCHFMKERVEFLGHVIEGGKVYPSPDKTVAVERFPEPKSCKDVQSFLGLTGYFRKFIPQYSMIAKPLSDLLKKDMLFQFEDHQKLSFERLKYSLMNAPVLHIYKPGYVTELHTDASKEGYGAVLLQKSPDDDQFHPVYYSSKKTTEAEKKYNSYELEVLAIISALKKFRVYLLGFEFTIVTDCSAFERTMHKKELATRVARWALLLEEFDYKIKHRPGVQMKHVDTLSRYPVMLLKESDLSVRLKRLQESDSEIKCIIEVLKHKPYDNYFVQHGLLYKSKDGQDLLVVPKAMQDDIIAEAHKQGHFAALRTHDLIKREYYIPDAMSKIQNHIDNCIHCILTNKKRGKQEGFLHPIPKDDVPLSTYHVDHLGPLKSTNKNYKHILAVIDSFTKFVWLYPTKSTTSKEVIAKLELQKKFFGNPMRIISDRGTAFTSDEFKSYCDEEKIQHLTITTGLPRANGQVERLNRTIIPVLTKLSLDDPSKWYKHVDRLQQILNATFHRSIGTSPFELMIGVKIKTSEDFKLKELIEQEFQAQFEESRRVLREKAKEQILKVQNENQKTFNKRRCKPREYKIGDCVAIKRTQLGPGRKLKAKFLGPYKITKIKPNDTYDVKRVDNLCDGPISTSTCAEYMKPWTVD